MTYASVLRARDRPVATNCVFANATVRASSEKIRADLSAIGAIAPDAVLTHSEADFSRNTAHRRGAVSVNFLARILRSLSSAVCGPTFDREIPKKSLRFTTDSAVLRTHGQGVTPTCNAQV
jgi:hypothetical protein